MNDFSGLTRDGRLVEVIRIVKSKRLFGTRMNTYRNCDEESKLPRLRPRFWSRLAHADSQSYCEKSVRLTGARAHVYRSRSHRVRVFDPTQILLLIGVLYVPTVLVFAQLGSRHVPTSFPETFAESCICRFSGGDTRFSSERADRLGLQHAKHRYRRRPGPVRLNGWTDQL